MERKTLTIDVDWKAGGGPGEVEGYASVFGNVDQVGDVVMPGAFRKTISDWTHASQPMPLTADHNLTTDGLIGSVTALSEDSHGLRFKARFSRSDKAQRIRQDILDGHIRGTSFIYEAINAKAGRFNGKAVRFLHELRLHEITVALGPLTVNPLAGVTSAKATSEPTTGVDPMADWLESMGHATAIADPRARKAAVDTLVANYPTETEPPAVTQDAGDTGDGAATTDPAGGTSTPDDAYAVGFLNSGPSDGTPTGEPPQALPGPLADLEHQRSIAEIDALEADLQSALEG